MKGELITYEEMMAIGKGERLSWSSVDGWVTGTVTGKGTDGIGGDYLWIQRDGRTASTKVYIGTSVRKSFWDEHCKHGYRWSGDQLV